ncbi:probable leucine-rich repeat receptor-like protein kinase At5g49770 [Mercurialis annua]|uniref:probable leucine-rich repeat receptor-like protein kinase At5g49770 n=1 Tax=Mercurialis annua TaxID=3986 RepID=UPI002160B343|nr:probable leucine-rich repeat receptor-like protein kinase At5g49770 [Mercurialis annua]
MIKTRPPSFNLVFLFFCIAASSSADLTPPDAQGSCSALNFTKFPYKPTGECIGDQKKVQILGSISTTLCCRNVLNFLTKTLAWKLSNTSSDSVFLPQDQWINCNAAFPQDQSPVSPFLCGFDYLYTGYSACSSYSLSSIKEDSYYKKAVSTCSSFNSAPYNDACSNCTAAISAAIDGLMSKLNAENGKAICTVAMIISIAAENVVDPVFIDDFYNCLPALDEFDVGYDKIKHSTLKAIFATFLAIVALMLVLILAIYVTKSRRKSKRPPNPILVRPKEIKSWYGLYRFSKAEIENAINYGDERKYLGRGSAGQVYKGVLPSGQVVAVKHIHQSSTSDSFQREVEGLSRVRHPNLVCLFGYCSEGDDRYLVYEYCSAGNLAQHLLRKENLLTWERRVQILRDCALGLRYLHHYIDGCVVHRDIKLTNILLTENLDPKLSDFGLAKMLGMEESKVFTDVRGTIGYMDPEYMTNAKLTCASDIYSFGIVILQILSGQKVIDLDLDARDQLTRKAKDVIMRKRPVTDFEDPRLKGQVNRADFEAILQIAVLCVAKSSKGRPTMDVVFEEMEKACKNTSAYMKKLRGETNTSATSISMSMEAIPV